MIKISRLTVILFFVVLGLRFTTMDRTYSSYTPKECSAVPTVNNFEVSQSFDLGDNKLILFGTKTAPKRGVGIVLYDTKLKQKVFENFSKGDEDFIKPYFFKTTLPSDPIVFLCSTGADYTYGVSVYTFHKSAVKYIGYMDIAMNESSDDSSTDPSPWTLISINDATTTFTFSKSVSRDFQGEKQKNYKAGELKYQNKDGKLTICTK